MSLRLIVLVLLSFLMLGCGDATVRPFIEKTDAGVDAGDPDGGDDDGDDDDVDDDIDDSPGEPDFE